MKNKRFQIRDSLIQICLKKATINVFEDFIHYQRGVYRHITGEFMGKHAIKILGWGTEHKQNSSLSYWIVQNSWSKSWGDAGFFKIAHGQCNIEQEGVGSVRFSWLMHCIKALRAQLDHYPHHLEGILAVLAEEQSKTSEKAHANDVVTAFTCSGHPIDPPASKMRV